MAVSVASYKQYQQIQFALKLEKLTQTKEKLFLWTCSQECPISSAQVYNAILSYVQPLGQRKLGDSRFKECCRCSSLVTGKVTANLDDFDHFCMP